MLGTFNTVANIKGTKVFDAAANVHDHVNYYRVLFKDHCGVAAAPGIMSNTILLNFQSQNRLSTKLSWNNYSYWHSGVRNYTVQLKNENGDFKDIKTFSPSVTQWDSINIESYKLDSICFRVYAVKDTLTSDTSWSNEICLVPASYIHVPTAFSPNDDKLNDQFKAISGFIHKTDQDPNNRFELRIYNRWGQMVFESFDPDLSWDGMFQGKKCESGLYVWNLKALGYDGVPHRLNGTVYLIR
jgi:gliding motility-associated-like protein